MSMITSATSVPSTTAATSTTANSQGLNALDNTQTFLNLLVTQLKNQDPTNPADPNQFMTELAQLTAVQSQTTLDAEQQTVAADSMIGKQVTGQLSTGSSLTGVVTGVLLSTTGGAPELQIGTGTSAQLLGLTSVTQIMDPSATSSTSSSTSTTSG